MPETRDYLAEARRELEWAEEKDTPPHLVRAHVERAWKLSYEIPASEEKRRLCRDIAVAALAQDNFITAYAACAACQPDAELRDSIIARDEETMPGRVLAKAYSRLASGPAYSCEDEDNAAKAGDE